MNTTRLCLLFVLLFGATPLWALPSDGDQPVNIEADWAEADEVRRITIYKGKVIVVQGSIRITGDVVTMYYNESSELNKLVSVGRPARFHQQVDAAGTMQRARATRLEYLVPTDTMILLNDATLSEGGKKVSADRIVYDTLNGKLKAEVKPQTASSGDGKTKRGRVKITIKPQNN
jgi:lipopolysaccharide export system protein LptA